jgi:hypothetical protein
MVGQRKMAQMVGAELEFEPVLGFHASRAGAMTPALLI